MSKSHPFQRARLFDGLVKRYHKKLPSMSLQALALAYNFDGPEQVRHALEILVETRHITGTFEGRYPTIHIWKERYRTVQLRTRPWSLLPPGSENGANRLKEDIPQPAVAPTKTITILPAQPKPPKPDYVATVEQIAKEVVYPPLPVVTAPDSHPEVKPSVMLEQVAHGIFTNTPVAPKPKINARLVRIAMQRKVDPLEMAVELAGQYLDIVGDNFDLKCGART